MVTTPIQPSATDVQRTASRSRAWHIDYLLLAATLGLVACSLYTLYGATRGDVAGQPLFYVERQAVYAGVGLVLMLLLTRFDYSRLREWKMGIYALLMASILLVLAIAGATRGSHRWIDLPFFRIQPSELGKVLLIVALAGFVVDRSRRLGERETTARVMLLALVPALLVIAQPDLGTGMVYVVVALATLYFAGTSWKHFASLLALGAMAITLVLVVAPATGHPVLKGYQAQRLTGFLSPSKDPRDITYQINESLIAVGSGQKTGRGVMHATQTRLNFLPENRTDFVFAVVGEQHGFVGAAIVLALYALLIWRALRILTTAKNLYGTLIAGGVMAMILFQVFVNVGMTLGIMPITGVPLPLLSFGGSSMLVTFLSLGLLQSIHVQGHVAAQTKSRATLM